MCASVSRPLVARFAVRELAGRGRGLVAVGDVASGEQLAAFAAYSHTCDSFEPALRSQLRDDDDDDGPTISQCCATCLRWGAGLPVRCSGCPAAYCSTACSAVADRRGHQLCCAALQRMHSMRPKPNKFSADERSAACFLLRAFAQRASERQAAADASVDSDGNGGSQGKGEGEGKGEGDGGIEGEPSFEDALAQEEELDHSAGVQRSHERSARLAKLQVG